MKNVLLTVSLLLCWCGCAYAQAQQNAVISGFVVDSVTNKPISYVTVGLVDSKTSRSIKSTYTNANGTFEFKSVPLKNYQLILVCVGYATKKLTVPVSDGPINVGRIIMQQVSHQLDGVSVTAVKPLMKQEVDRLSYDVQADPESKMLNVLDMLRKVPLLSVDANDNIKLQGNTNYRILINGKPSALVSANPADILRAMPAINIQKIEVITTPPAKYDAEGLAGIINIITKKNDQQGYNGSVTTRYSNLFGRGTNLSLNGRKGKLGLAGFWGYTRQNRLTTGFHNTSDNFGVSYLTQDGSRSNRIRNSYLSNELSYEADSLNLLTASFELSGGNTDFENDQLTSQLSDVIRYQRAYQSVNGGRNRNGGIGAGANYQLGFKRSKDQLLTISYKFNWSLNKQFNDVSYLSKVNFADPDYMQYNNAGSREHTLQLDYIHPLKRWNIEAGAKAIFRKNYSDYNTDTLQTGNGYVTDAAQSNNFDYQQNIYSLYNTYQLKLSHWVFKGGLRLEHTTINTYNNTLGINPYTNLIPSLSVQRSFGSGSLNFGYTDRIQRPGILQLNPFADRTNTSFRTVGNPNLRPVVSHGIELVYSNYKKGSFNVSLNYHFANNTIEDVVSANGVQGVSVTTYQNVGKNKRLGIDMNVSYPITPKFNFNLNAELTHVWLRGMYNGEFYNNRGFQGHTFGNASYRFDNGYRLGASIDFDSRYVLLQGRDNYYLGYGASVSKDFWRKKATISANLSNPFNKYRNIDGYTRTPYFYQFTSSQSNARRLNLSLVYKFGKLSNGIKRNRRGISNDDLSGGRGSE